MIPTTASKTLNSIPELELSIAIVSFNVKDYLRRCLRALESNSGQVRHEIFVVDNASQDGTAEMVGAEFPEVHLIRNKENRYFSKANNQAIAMAKGEFVLLLNPDAEIKPHALESMIQYLRDHPDAGIAGPRLLNPDGTFQRSCYRHYTLAWGLLEISLLNGLFPRNPFYKRHYYFERDFTTAEPQDVDVVTAACLMTRLTLLRRLGGMDENYRLYGEEIDLCLRAAQTGNRTVYVPAAQVIHHIGGATTRLSKTSIHRFGADSHLIFVRKYYPFPVFAMFSCLSWITLNLLLVKHAFHTAWRHHDSVQN